MINKALVAEIHPAREASSEELRRLGEALAACQRAQPWIAEITHIDDLLDGRLPSWPSDAPFVWNKRMPPEIPLEHGLLVWGKLPCPVPGPVDVRGVLNAAVPAGLATVEYSANLY